MKSQQAFDEAISLISTVAAGVLDTILNALSGRPSISERQRLYEQHQKTLADYRAKGDEMLRRLRKSRERMEANHERNQDRCRKARASVDEQRLDLAASTLSPDEVRRKLLVIESMMKSIEYQLETDRRRIAEARRRERHASSELSRANSKWERLIERERAGLEKDGSVSGVLRRVWRIISTVLLYFLVTDRISGRRNTRN